MILDNDRPRREPPKAAKTTATAQRDLIYPLAAGLFMAILLAIDMSAELGVAVPMAYVVVVLLGMWAPQSWFIPAAGIGGTLCTVLGYYLSPHGGEAWKVLTNRALAIALVWITAYLCCRLKKTLAVSFDSEKRLHAVADTMYDAVIVIDENAAVVSFNVSAENCFGYSADEIIGKNVSTLMPEPYRSEHDRYLKNYLASGQSKIIGIGREVVGLRKGGTTFQMDLYVNEVFLQGRRHFVGTVRDITKRKRIEDEVLRAKERTERFSSRLTENKAFLEAILNTMIDGVITIEEHGAILSVNPNAARIFGYKSAELFGRDVKILMPSPFREEHDHYLKSYMQTGQAKIIGIGREVVGLRKDGSVFPMDLAVSETEFGGKRHFVGVVRDITERKQAERETQRAREMAEKANRAKSEFLANMSHELRTPLNVLLGFGQLLEFNHTSNLSPDQIDGVDQILKSGNHLLELINEVLDLARIESGSLKIQLEHFDFRQQAMEVNLLMQPLADEAKITLHNRIEGQPPVFIQADSFRLKQCVLNLLSNAIKYNHPGGSVTLDCARDNNGRVTISVHDTGKGIAEEKLADLFQPFERLGAENSAVQGTGIGLTITKKLIEHMGGAIVVTSRPGEGSTFSLVLQAGNAEHIRSEPVAVEPIIISATKKSKILYIEDNEDNRSLLQFIIKGQRPQVQLFLASTGVEGLSLTAAENFDLILCDIQLPGMDGYEIVSCLKSADKTRHIPVIALSAQAMAADIDKAMRLGFSDYIVKPIKVPNLLGVVDRFLQ
jgi:PAS domain S-box-containing protein